MRAASEACCSEPITRIKPASAARRTGAGREVWCSPWQAEEWLGSGTEHLSITMLMLARPQPFPASLVKFPFIPALP